MDLQAIAEVLRSFWVLWLFLIFVAIVVWTMWPSRKKNLEKLGRIPLDDDK